MRGFYSYKYPEPPHISGAFAFLKGTMKMKEEMLKETKQIEVVALGTSTSTSVINK
jgi:hypothetical protein